MLSPLRKGPVSYGTLPRMQRRVHRPLLVVDSQVPSEQWLPSVANASADVVARGLPTPQGVYLFDSATSTHAELTGNGAPDIIDDGNGIRAQPAVGLYDTDGSMNAASALESPTTVAVQADSAESTFGDLGVSGSGKAISVAVLARTITAGGLHARKADISGGVRGWYQITNGTNFGSVAADGSTTKTSTVAANHDDGAYHWFVSKTTRLGDTLQAFSDLGAGAEVDISSLGTMDNANGIGWGLQPGFSNGPKGGQVICMILWTDANAELIDSTAPAKLSGVGIAPAAARDVIDFTNQKTTTRTCLVGDDATEGELVNTYAPNQWPYDWRLAHMEGAGGFGYQGQRSHTNLCLHSEDLGDAVWVAATCDTATNDRNAPNGFKHADKLTQTGAGGGKAQTIAGLAGSTRYVFSYFAQTSDGGHDITCSLRNAADSADLVPDGSSSATHSATDKRKRFFTTVTTEPGQTSMIAITRPGQIADTDKDCHIWGLMLHASAAVDHRAPYIKTTSTAATTDDDAFSVDNTAEQYLKHAEGEIRALAVLDAATADAHGGSLDQNLLLYQPAGNANRHDVYLLNSSGSLNGRIYNASGVLQGGAEVGVLTPTLTDENEYRQRWVAATGIPDNTAASADVVVNGAQEADDNESTFTTNATTGSVKLFLGTGGEWWEGSIALLEIYAKPRRLAA